ncbi:hypothetical protein C9446_17275 [Providencia heimbachae]|uniref:hypothetical protein n=1 Tax=Providencia heimbachae TaxID=333962 RepID=UPI0010BE3735|nr:hypothetical protein [Providencia heimbachae]QCJ71438.1 hypothetical protein C9446_17275 [Providencia heimbachae]
MNEKRIEQIVAQVLQSLKKKVLVVLSPAQGYEQAIYQRLMQLSTVSFSVYVTNEMLANPCSDKWSSLGNILTKSTFETNMLMQYQAVFLPFIDAKTVGEVANGLFTSEESQITLAALALAMPVMALKYHCCPESELNQVLGLNKNKHYNNLIKDNINKAISLGINFDSFNDIENKLLLESNELNIKSKTNQINSSRYITLNEVMNDPGGYSTNKNKLTDSATDYLKSLKK